jgi:hypothetical protein
MYDNEHITGLWVSLDEPCPAIPLPNPLFARRSMSKVQHIVIEDDSRLLAEAVVESHPDLVDAMLRVEAGHFAPGATVRLVNAVLDLMQVPPGTAMEMTFPTGQAEMLEQIRRRCPDVTTRVAGVSCRLHTTVPTPPPARVPASGRGQSLAP